MFDARSDTADWRAFAERCEMTVTISGSSSRRRTLPNWRISASSRASLWLMWKRPRHPPCLMAADHWNTDNPHVHILIRGKAEDGQHLVISRAYISRGFHDRAAERVTLELGQGPEREIRSALEREVDAERWTGLDRALRTLVDEGGGVAALRPCPYRIRRPSLRGTRSYSVSRNARVPDPSLHIVVWPFRTKARPRSCCCGIS
jgi:hypothetical protein